MNDEVRGTAIPVVWPNPVRTSASWESGISAPWTADPLIIDCLFCVTYDLDDRGINWLAGLLGKPDFQCRLVLLLYPACATQQEHLVHLVEWQNTFGGKFAIR